MAEFFQKLPNDIDFYAFTVSMLNSEIFSQSEAFLDLEQLPIVFNRLIQQIKPARIGTSGKTLKAIIKFLFIFVPH